MLKVGRKSIALLGSGLAVHLLKRATLSYDPGGVPRFRDNFDGEGLTPLSLEEHGVLSELQGCLHCGLCDLVCPDLLGPLLAARPSELASATLKNLPAHFELGADAEPVAACDSCGRCRDICPAGIDLKSLARFVVRAAPSRTE